MENEKEDKFIAFTNGSKIEIPQIADMSAIRGGRAKEFKAWWDLLEEDEEDSQ